VDYCLFARDYVRRCEEKYGYDAVEATLDAAHALEQHGVDKYRRPSPLSAAAEKAMQQQRMEEAYKSVYELWNTVPGIGPDGRRLKQEVQAEKTFPEHPQENILYFLEKNSPILEDWQRELVRIVQKLSQYFYPQMLTKTSNEGYATFWHYKIIYKLFDLGYVTDGFMQSFLDLHTRVVHQPDWNKGGTSMGRLNPY
jgi:stage V sporulation protein R